MNRTILIATITALAVLPGAATAQQGSGDRAAIETKQLAERSWAFFMCGPCRTGTSPNKRGRRQAGMASSQSREYSDTTSNASVEPALCTAWDRSLPEKSIRA